VCADQILSFSNHRTGPGISGTVTGHHGAERINEVVVTRIDILTSDPSR